jgi:hypothetical protein
MMSHSNELRKQATWYREFAERAGNPWIWEARLRTAERLEAEAARVEFQSVLSNQID